MSKNVLFAAMLIVAVAACAKKQETVLVDEPAVTQEPVYTGKL